MSLPIKGTKSHSYSNIIKYSPNNLYLAVVHTFKLLIFPLKQPKLIPSFTKSFKDEITHIKWSSNSQWIIVGVFVRNLIFVQSITKEKQYYKIYEGLYGVVNSLFVPKSTHKIININKYNIRLTVWNVIEQQCHFINDIKFPDKRSLIFSKKDPYMCIAKRKISGEYLSIVNYNDWTTVKDFQLKTFDLQNIKWSYDYENIFVIDSEIECSLFIYHANSGELIKHIQPYENKMGISTFKKSPHGNFFMLGCYDGNAYLYAYGSDMMLIDIFEHGLLFIDNNVIILQEYVYKMNQGNEKESRLISYFNTIEVPYKIEIDDYKDTPQNNVVNLIEWSGDGSFVCTTIKAVDNVLWIWRVKDLSLYKVIIFKNPITNMKCSSVSTNILIILCNSSRTFFYEFNKHEITAYESKLVIPPNKVLINKEGDKFILANNTNFLSCLINVNKEQIINNLEQGQNSMEIFSNTGGGVFNQMGVSGMYPDNEYND